MYLGTVVYCMQHQGREFGATLTQNCQCPFSVHNGSRRSLKVSVTVVYCNIRHECLALLLPKTVSIPIQSIVHERWVHDGSLLFSPEVP